MRALVLGGAGFIGSHLCEALLDGGHEVACVDNFSLGTAGNIRHLARSSAFRLFPLDASERRSLGAVFRQAAPEYVFHLAANSDIRASAAVPGIDFRNTYATTFHVLECMREFGAKHLFFASSSAVYGDKRDVLLDEDAPGLAPVSYYGAAKLGSEALISAYAQMNGLHALVFRFPNVVGPRLTHGVVLDFLRKLRANPRELEILGDGKQTKPYLHVQDLIGAIRFFHGRVPQGMTVYQVGGEGETSVEAIAGIVCEEMGLFDVRYRYTGGEGGWKGDVPRFRYHLGKIHRAGWRARLSSDEAVRQAVREMLSGEGDCG